MTIALTAALVAVVIANTWLVDRLLNRHAKQTATLLVHVQAPETAVAHAISAHTDAPLYLPPEDDKAWNEQHRAAD